MIRAPVSHTLPSATLGTYSSRRAFLAALPLGAALAGCRRGSAGSEAAFRIALPYDVSSLDPHASTTTGAFTTLGNVFEPLVFAHTSQILRPGLAWRWTSPDPLTWIFELRPGVRFHSGRPLEAADVVHTYERVMRGAALDARYYLGEVAEVEALDTRSVRLRARRRTPVLLRKLSHVYITPAQSTREADGTGPYAVTAWTPRRLLSLARTDSYWDEPPALKSATISLNLEPQEVVDGLQSGAFEMALLGLPRQGALLDASDHYRQQRRGTLHVKYLAFDLGRDETPFCSVLPNPFLDRRVREAVLLGIDRRLLVERLPTYAATANQLVPREVFGFAPELAELKPDAQRARRLLLEAGMPARFQATLHTRELLKDAARVVAEQLGQIGIELEVRPLEDAAYFTGLAGRKFSFWLDRWSCTTGDSMELFENALHSPAAAGGLGSFNESAYRNRTLDRMIDEALELESPPARRSALEKLMVLAMRELPWIPLYTDEEVWAIDRAFVWEPRVDHWLHVADVRGV
jgi:peptide/nickel transport system substrate-binding protein